MAKIHCHSLLSGSSWTAFDGETSEDESEGIYDIILSDPFRCFFFNMPYFCTLIVVNYFSLLSYGGGRYQ